MFTFEEDYGAGFGFFQKKLITYKRFALTLNLLKKLLQKKKGI